MIGLLIVKLKKFYGGWRNLFKNTTKIVLKFAEENQNIKVNIKGKHR